MGGDEICSSLAESLDSIIDIISHSNGALYDITSHQERKQQEYENGLSYNKVKKLKITKEKIYEHFRFPGIDQIPNTSKEHILIGWCTYQPF